MVWDWNPFSFSIFESSRSREAFYPTEDGTTILDLPREIRNHIWKDLSDVDHQAIRNVCRPFKWEIENIVGVRATLHGPRLWKDWTFTDEARFILSFGQDHARRAEENVDWVQSVLVRSLDLKRLSDVTFNPKTLISNPFLLHRLAMEVEFGSPHRYVLEMLGEYNYLQVLHLSCCPVNQKVGFSDFFHYRTYALEFTMEVLGALRPQIHLKELTVSSRVETLPFGWGLTNFRALPPALQGPHQFPMRLRTLHLTFPLLQDEAHLQAWKSLLDNQESLTELKVNFGFVYWKYFTRVLAVNRNSLQSLDLCLGNFLEQRTLGEEGVVPDDHSLTWNELLPNPAPELRSLKVSMSDIYPRFLERPNPTRNFDFLQLNRLQTLSLTFVALQLPDFTHIFTALPSLEDIDLSYWTFSLLPDYTAVANGVFGILANAVFQLGRVRKVKLVDWSIRSVSEDLRDAISGYPNYTAVWPAGTQRTFASYFFDCKNVFKLKRTTVQA